MTPTEAQRRLAAEFERRGWDWDLTVGRSIIAAAERGDASSAARRVPREFLERSGASEGDVADAVQRAFGGQGVGAGEAPATVVINDHSFHLNVGAGATISGKNINVGSGTLVNIDASADKDDVLAAVATVVRAGVTGDWDPDAARALAEAIDARDDVNGDEVREITAEVVEEAGPKQGRVKEMLEKVATSGLGGALATGISAGLGQVIAHLPL